jgi:uncharacterized membrane protein YuzA (DUF378 family)
MFVLNAQKAAAFAAAQLIYILILVCDLYFCTQFLSDMCLDNRSGYNRENTAD